MEKCDLCGKLFEPEDIVHYDSGDYCKDCANKLSKQGKL